VQEAIDYVSNLPFSTVPALVGNAGKSLFVDGAGTALDFAKTGGIYCTATGSDAVALTTGLSLAAKAAGDQLSWIQATLNTGAVTIAVDGGATAPLVQNNGSAIPAGKLIAGDFHTASYDGTNWVLNDATGIDGTVIGAKTAAPAFFTTVQTNVGSAAAPTHSFISATDAGMYYDLGGTSLNFAVGGSTIMRVGTNTLVHGTATAPGVGNTDTGVALRFDTTSCFSGSGVGIYCNTNTIGGANISFRNSGTGVGQITTNGSSTSYATTSDYRTKENITPVQGAVELIRALNPVTYTAISDGQWYDGFLAHEVQTILPTAVTGEKDKMKEIDFVLEAAAPDVLDDKGKVIKPGKPEKTEKRTVPDIQQMDYAKLTPLLTAGLQAAYDLIDSLEARIAALEAKK
jgi:hypothetical protein